MSIRMMLVYAAILVTSLFQINSSFGLDVPSMAAYNLNWNEMITPETHEGIIMATLGKNQFVLNEKNYVLLKESDINGVSADKASVQLRKGTKVRIVSYRTKNKTNFVSDLTILK